MRQFPESHPVPAEAKGLPASDPPAALDGLSFAPRLIIWAARLWWQDRGAKDGSRRMLAQAFTLARCPGAETAFDELMLMALHGACRHLDFACHVERLGRDEQALLDVIAAFQDHAVIGGERALDAWLPPATARLASDSAILLAKRLSRAGLLISEKQIH